MEPREAFFPAKVKISGIGRSLPSRRVLAEEIDRLCSRETGAAAAVSGVQERRWVGGDESAISLGVEAAREALEDAEIPAAEVGLLINASGTPYQLIPDNAAIFLKELGLGVTGIPGFSVHNTCLSLIPAIQVAAQFLTTSNVEHILIISSDVTSPGISFKSIENAALFGDAAAALVLSRASADCGSCIEGVHMATYGDGVEHSEIRGGGSRIHANQTDIDPDEYLFSMNGKALLKFAVNHLAGFLEAFQPGLSSGLLDIDYVIPHQASRLGLTMLRKFNWPEDKIIQTLPFLGNCVAASIPATLYEGIKNGPIQSGDRLLIAGTGAGISIAGVVLVL